MKLSSLNIKHAKLLDKYIKYLQGIAYEATEFSSHKKFEEFNEILYNISLTKKQKVRDIMKANIQSRHSILGICCCAPGSFRKKYIYPNQGFSTFFISYASIYS